MADERREDHPHDRLTRICDAMITTLDEHPENGEDVKCIVFLDNGARGGMVLHGYDSDTDAMVDVLMHLKAIFKANGKELMVVPIGSG